MGSRYWACIPALFTLAALDARAADLPQVPAIAASQQFDWTGIYVGAHIGYGWGHVGRGGGAGTHGAPDGDSDGVLGGAQVGANWQWNSFVLGGEADISGVDLTSDSSTPGGVTILHTEVNYFGTVRGRLGIAFDRFLVYGTGGLAYADFDQRYQILGVQARDSGAQLGWTAGGGIEVAIDEHWSVKAEYLYADLGSEKYYFRNDAGGLKGHLKVSYDQQLARIGLNYKF